MSGVPVLRAQDQPRRGSRSEEFFAPEDSETSAISRSDRDAVRRPSPMTAATHVRGFKDGVVYLDMKAPARLPVIAARCGMASRTCLRHYVPDVVRSPPDVDGRERRERRANTSVHVCSSAFAAMGITVGSNYSRR